MAVPARVSLITLGARDADALGTFYRRLGWTEGPSADDGFRSFLLGSVVLALYPLEALGAEAAPGDPAPAADWRGTTLAINLPTREATDEAFEAFVEAGGIPVAPPVDRPWGGRSGYVADPEGNRWELAWNPGLVFDEHGRLVRFGDAVP